MCVGRDLQQSATVASHPVKGSWCIAQLPKEDGSDGERTRLTIVMTSSQHIDIKRQDCIKRNRSTYSVGPTFLMLGELLPVSLAREILYVATLSAITASEQVSKRQWLLLSRHRPNLVCMSGIFFHGGAPEAKLQASLFPLEQHCRYKLA